MITHAKGNIVTVVVVKTEAEFAARLDETMCTAKNGCRTGGSS
ncbi:hypothetical protein BRO54_3764 [Geobacillus proteiniphilus]|uniref:Uncharacterized protein n=1 Tax=Geobacillus proteiniphilus TaxID=860353 RepID=A0A1Q5SIY8_9BACL|nr:hypothetical protein BRO54_3764 [Geobacillus proteiniphilus]